MSPGSEHERNTPEGLSFRRILEDDLNSVANVHRKAFHDSAITSLGFGAIVRYYRSLMSSVHEVYPVGMWMGGTLVGFCFGGTLRSPERHFVVSNLGYLILCGLRQPSLIFNGRILSRIGTALRVAVRRPERSASEAHSHRWELVDSYGIQSIAVDPGHQGNGYGTKLMWAVEQEARAMGYTRMDLSVHPSNKAAHALYTRCGWNEISHAKSWTGIMGKELQDA